MNDLNILSNEAAMAVLQRAADALKALGVNCVLAPMSLPQGMSVSLHVGATVATVEAANVASTWGGEMAQQAATSEEFASKVAYAISNAAIDRAASDKTTLSALSPAPWEEIGRAAVDSGKLMLVDPCYIDHHWENEPFKDIRIHRHLPTGKTLQYKVDFSNYGLVIPAYGKSMNSLFETGEWEDVVTPIPPGLSYNSVCRTTINGLAGEVAGLAVAFQTGYGDGHFPVFVRKNHEGRIMKVLIDFAESEDDAIQVGIVPSHS